MITYSNLKSISFILGQKDVPRDFLVGSSREMEGYALQVVAQLGGGAQTFARKRSFVAPERIRGTTFRRIFVLSATSNNVIFFSNRWFRHCKRSSLICKR